MGSRIKPLTESGILAALTVIMAAIGVYVPFLGVIAILMWPLPVIVLIVRHGMRWGVMAVVVSAVLTAALLEPVVAVRLPLAFGPGGIALAYGYRHKWPAVRIFTAGVVASLLAKAAALALVAYITGVQPFEMQFNMMDESFASAVGMYESIGMNAEQIAAAEQNFKANMTILRLLLPLLLFFMGLMDTTLNFILGGKLLQRLGNPVPTFPPFVEWRLPGAFMYIYCFALLGMYWAQTREIELLYKACVNLSMLATFAGMIEGFALLKAAQQHYRWPAIAVTIASVLMFFSSFLMQMLSFTGLLDMVFDYRTRLWGKKR